MANVFIARQPIYSFANELFAYELLYRHDNKNQSDIDDETDATIQTLMNALVHIGLSNIVGKNLAFVNLSEAFLYKSYAIPFTPEQIAFDISLRIPCNEKTLKGVKRLRKKGYTVAISYSPKTKNRQAFYKIADIIRVNQQSIPMQDLVKAFNSLKCFPGKRLLEGIETREQFNSSSKIFPDFYQGFYFRKPQIISAQKIPSNRMAALNLLSKLQDDDVEVTEIDELIKQDVTLSLKLMRSINSARYGLPREVSSISEAVVYLGLVYIKQWATLVILANIDDKPQELILSSLIRSKMCELIATDLKRENTSTYALIGLFSLVDALMDAYMGEILAHLPFSTDIVDALHFGKGPYSDIFNCVTAYDSGDWEFKNDLALSTEEKQQYYVTSVQWATEICADLF
ncbi:MAG: HDOD domain-containing protein [Methylococcales bacterium]|nr:HDOD domain-containing protein [Methylococcales bacterium]